MDEVGTGLGLDVNVLRVFQSHFYDQFSVDAVAAPTTAVPTMMPVTGTPSSATTIVMMTTGAALFAVSALLM